MTILLIALGVAGLWALYFGLFAIGARRNAVERLAAHDDERQQASNIGLSAAEERLRRWLALAGYRRPAAPALFVVSCLAAVAAAALVAWAVSTTVIGNMVANVSDIPGGVGETLAAMLQTSPAIFGFMIAGIPVFTVRAARRHRIEEIERDLPLVLELFATLAQAGLAFDAALSRIVGSSRRERPLIQELQHFQRDLVGGIPRVQALRQLARRIDVTSMTIFVSAIIQAEQVGAGVTETLRHQSEDLRDRRRERALLEAQALPVKLVFPLVACFLPSIFVTTIGPVLFQMVDVANTVVRPVVR